MPLRGSVSSIPIKWSSRVFRLRSNVGNHINGACTNQWQPETVSQATRRQEGAGQEEAAAGPSGTGFGLGAGRPGIRSAAGPGSAGPASSPPPRARRATGTGTTGKNRGAEGVKIPATQAEEQAADCMVEAGFTPCVARVGTYAPLTRTTAWRAWKLFRAPSSNTAWQLQSGKRYQQLIGPLLRGWTWATTGAVRCGDDMGRSYHFQT